MTIAAILVLVTLAVGYALLRNYLHSDAFRRFLSAEASATAGVAGEFAPFRWDGLAVNTDSFQATGNGPVTALRADGLHTEVGLGGVRRGVWEIRGSRVRRLEVSVDTTRPLPENKISSIREKSHTHRGPAWFPNEAELQSLDVREVAVKAILEQGLAIATGLSLHAEQAGGKGAYRGEIEGGTIRLPFGFVPELRLDRARLRYQDGRIFLTSATLGAWAGGRLEGSGEGDLKSRQFALEGNATGLKCEDILSADWSKRLIGGVMSSFTVDNHHGFSQASGKLTIQNGELTALPMLDALAAYADTRRFRVLSLSEAHMRWRWKVGEISLSELVLASEGLVRLEGNIDVHGRKIDGIFRLGLAPGTLSTIPGAETDVFVAGERGLLWTTLRISGTLDDPKEDLTDRLIQAAGVRMFDQIPESGGKFLKFTRSILGEPSSNTLEKGVKFIEKNSDTIREVRGILGDLIGRDSPEPPQKDQQAE